MKMTADKRTELIQKIHLMKTAKVNNRAQVHEHLDKAEQHLVRAYQNLKNVIEYNAAVTDAARELMTAAAWAKREAY